MPCTTNFQLFAAAYAIQYRIYASARTPISRIYASYPTIIARVQRGCADTGTYRSVRFALVQILLGGATAGQDSLPFGSAESTEEDGVFHIVVCD